MEAVAPHRRLAGRYVLDERIASGGMASVWRARDEVLARTVAVKVLHGHLARDPAFLERFRREAVAAARLTHSCIVSVFDTGMDADICYIVMEDFGTTTLRDLRGEGPLPPARAVGFVLPVLSALAFAHSMEIVHRDIEPENILVGPEDRVKVTDFGLARAAFVGGDITTTGQVLGSVRYLSPEQVQGTDVDGRSDLYSTGAVLYELLTGRPPFEAGGTVATAMMRLTKDPLAPRAVRPGIPRDVDAAVMKAMARRPADRFSTAEAMRAALERFEFDTMPEAASTRQVPVLTDASPPAGPPRESTFRSWMLVPLLLVLVATAVIAAVLVLPRLGTQGSARGAAASAGDGTEVRVAAVRDYDPEGDDRVENHGEVGLAVDGDPSTAWTTVHYDTAFFGRLKDGVGLFLDLGGDVAVTRVVVRSPLPGWTFELKGGTLTEGLSEPLADHEGRTSFTMEGGSVQVDLEGVTTPGVLIWITGLAPDGGRFSAAIAEVELAGTPT
jgi:serine/threonine-protein kinase